MVNYYKFIISIFHLSIIVCCSQTLNLQQKSNSWYQRTSFIARRINNYDNLINHHDYANNPQRITFEQICGGQSLIALGACSDTYIRCSYNSTNHSISAILDECPIGKIFNGTICEVAQKHCINKWIQRMEKINFETEKLLEERNFCYDRGPGIYMFTNVICSRQAYVCKNYNEGFATTCPSGMIMLSRPFGCFAYPPSCEQNKISMKQFAPLRQYAIEMYCTEQYLTKRYYREMISSMMRPCTTWYVRCGKLIKDIIYCEKGYIYDEKLKKCRLRNTNDHCIMPDFCENRKWKMVSLGACSRQFMYCRGQVPEEFVCSKNFIFFNGRCIPTYQASSQCWKCREGQQRHTIFQSCNEYSICKNGHWEDHSCPSGMIYFEDHKICRSDPSCVQPFKCKIGQSYRLKCDEYLICSWQGIFEHHFCPPFHRWDDQEMLCVPDTNCLSSSNEPCKEGEIIDSFDCKYYHQCSDGKWHKITCPIYPSAEICTICRHDSNIIWQSEEKCNDGDTVADPQDCSSYALCVDRSWKSIRCKVGFFWNENLKRCHYSSNCKAFKRAECSHGQYLVGDICNEYLKCIDGSWMIMKCPSGYVFDIITKKCVISNDCIPSNNIYLSLIDHDITSRLLFQSEIKLEQNQHQQKLCQFGNIIRNEYDCSRYFECIMNEYEDRYCKDNYEFNDATGQCEKEYHCDLSRCLNGRKIESEICGHYLICLNDTWYQRICENNRRYANGHCQKTYCNSDNDDNDEITSISSLSICKEGNVLADDDDIDCKRYFICRNGRFQEQFCWNGASFDKKLGYCVRSSTTCISEERCIKGSTKAYKQDRTAYHICNNGKFELQFCPYGLIYIGSNQRCEKDNNVIDVMYDICKESDDSTGYRADPTNCQKFYQCVHGKWVSKTCPAKLYWNVEKTTCDWFYYAAHATFIICEFSPLMQFRLMGYHRKTEHFYRENKMKKDKKIKQRKEKEMKIPKNNTG
ncbi:Peritrophin-44 [Dirofilaria immitis]